MNFFDNLAAKVDEKNSRVCLGLDPFLDGKAAIPRFILDQHPDDKNGAILEFNTRVLEAVGDIIPVVKPQSAFYEAHDAHHALKETIRIAKKMGLLVILDAKRNDIGSTSEAYATAAFDIMQADALTVNAYLGTDGVIPFLKHDGKGIFVLVKTSNPGSGDFQDLFSVSLPGIPAELSRVAVNQGMHDSLVVESRGDVLHVGNILLERNYLQMAKLVNRWNDESKERGTGKYGAVGAVVGATYPAQLKQLRAVMGSAFLLVPGYGTQGGTANDVKHGFLPGGTGAIVNSSRALLYAYALSKEHATAPERFCDATRVETLKMRDEINAAL